MSKSHVEELNEVYRRIFQDALYAYPALREEFEKDQVRLSMFVDARGIHAYCVDLPAVGKHLDRCLSNGEYKLSGLPMTGRYSGRVVIPKFLRGLYLLVFDEHGCLKGDCDVSAIAFLRQILYAGKKAALQCSDEKVADEVQEFLIVDNTLPIPEKFWSAEAPTSADVRQTYTSFSASQLYAARLGGLDPLIRARLSTFLTCLDFVSGLVTTTLGAYRYAEWRFRHGPGAVSNLTGGSNKYCWTNWSDRLENAFPIADCGFHNYGSWSGNIEKSEISSQEPFSKLVDVPKTFTKPRLIATEPSEHQWCQQNIWHYLGTRVKNSWISKFVRFHDQTRNQDLCRRGSQDQRLITVDLSAASDRVTCHFVGQLFRSNPDLLVGLQASRTRFIEYDSRHDGKRTLELRKFSTMGSACTFPVETLSFLCIALSAVMATRQMRPTKRNVLSMSEEVTIFGDDIIVPKDSRELLFEALEVLDFKVNTSKSYWNGMFRESCGVDSYAGHDVSPAYWKAPYSGKPESYASVIGVSNNFYDKFLVNTSSYIASTIDRYNVPIVHHDSGVCGFKSFVGPHSHNGKTRWNVDLQRREALVPCVFARSEKLPLTDDSSLLQYFSEDPSPFIHWVGGVAKRPEPKIRLRWVPEFELLSSKE